MNTKLYVGNLSFNTTENDLHDAFAQHGPVAEVNIMIDRMSGRSRGFGFVTMATPEAAQAAVSGMNGVQLDGRALTVNEARPKEERPGGGGGGGGRGFGGGGGGGGFGGGSGGGGGYGGGGGGGGGRDRGPRRDFRSRY
jgi:RNA recognition motif-containing protein